MGNLEFQIKIEKLTDGSSVAMVDLKGSIDGSTVKNFEAETLGLFEKGIKFLILNCAQVGYMNSTGLGILVKVLDKYQEKDGDLKLVRVPRKVADLFEMLGISSILTIYQSMNEAISSLPAKMVPSQAQPQPQIQSKQEAVKGTTPSKQEAVKGTAPTVSASKAAPVSATTGKTPTPRPSVPSAPVASVPFSAPQRGGIVIQDTSSDGLVIQDIPPSEGIVIEDISADIPATGGGMPAGGVVIEDMPASDGIVIEDIPASDGIVIEDLPQQTEIPIGNEAKPDEIASGIPINDVENATPVGFDLSSPVENKIEIVGGDQKISDQNLELGDQMISEPVEEKMQDVQEDEKVVLNASPVELDIGEMAAEPKIEEMPAEPQVEEMPAVEMPAELKIEEMAAEPQVEEMPAVEMPAELKIEEMPAEPKIEEMAAEPQVEEMPAVEMPAELKIEEMPAEPQVEEMAAEPKMEEMGGEIEEIAEEITESESEKTGISASKPLEDSKMPDIQPMPPADIASFPAKLAEQETKKVKPPAGHESKISAKEEPIPEIPFDASALQDAKTPFANMENIPDALDMDEESQPVSAVKDAPKVGASLEKASQSHIGGASRGLPESVQVKASTSLPTSQASTPLPVSPVPAAAPASQGSPAMPPPSSVIKRKTTVRYYQQMNPHKIFPLAVTLSKESIAKVAIQHVQQKEGQKVVEVKKEKPEVTITPCLSGCLVTPSSITLDVTPETSQAEFWVTPIIEGEIVGWVEIFYQGKSVEKISLKTRSVKQTWAKIGAAGAVLTPLLSYIIDGFKLNKEVLEGVPRMIALVDEQLGLVLFGLISMVFFILIGLIFYLKSRPKEAEILEKFFSTEPKKD